MISRHKTAFWIKNNSIDVSIKNISGIVDIHWHEFYEIEILLSGSGVYTIDGIDYKIEKGTLFFMSPSSFHNIKFSENTKLINLMFTPDICDLDFLCGLFDSSPHISLNLSETDLNYIHTLAKDMLTIHSAKYLKTTLNCILGKIQSLYSKNSASVTNEKMQYAILYIQNHFKENLRLDDLAREINYTPNYFSNKFKKYVGVTFKNYISDLRFSMAKNMLEKTDLSVTEICYYCGFSDFTNFMVSFKKRYDVTPKKYRDNSRKMLAYIE